MSNLIKNSLDSLYRFVYLNGRNNRLIHFGMAAANLCRVVLFPGRIREPLKRDDILREVAKYNTPNYTEREKKRLARDYFWTYVSDFVTLDDYITLDFFRKKRIARRTYYTESFYQQHYYCNRYNDLESRELLGNKSLFAEKMGKDFGRRVLNFTDETTREEFDEFVSHCSAIIVKPNFSYFGYGIQKEMVTTQAEIDDLWERLRAKYYMKTVEDLSIVVFFKDNKAYGTALLEECIVSDPELASFHPESLNTFRVFTVIGKNGPHIVCAYLRMGVGSSFMDHTSEGAIAAPVDLESGIITAPAMDWHMNPHIVHPDTGKQIVGFHVPKWNECVEEVKRLSLQLPDLHLIGWDMVLTAEGRWIPVEGNALPGSPLWQYLTGQGIVPILEEQLNG